MANVTDKIEMLEMFRRNPDKYLPVSEQSLKVFPPKVMGTEWYDDPQHNIGWDTGLLKGNRPYFMECWATCGITMLTYFISAEGMEDAETEDLLNLLAGAGLFTLRDPENPRASVMKFEEEKGNFFSVNITVADEEETFLDGGTVYPYKELNAYNRKNNREAEKEKQEQKKKISE